MLSAFGFHLLFRGELGQFVDVLDDCRIVHASPAHHIVLGKLASKDLLCLVSQFALDSGKLEPQGYCGK